MNHAKHTVLPALICLLSLGVCLAGCGRTNPILPVPTAQAETTSPTLSPEEQVESLTLVLDADGFQELEKYPNLKTLDLTGSTCYEAIARYQKFHPQVNVIYTIRFGSQEVSPSATELSLGSGDYDFPTLLENLRFLPELKHLSLSQLSFTGDELDQLQAAYPNLELTYSVMLFGSEFPSDTRSINLSFLTPDQVREAARGLSLLPELTSVELMDAEGSSQLEKTDVKLLVDAAPQAIFHYTFQLFGKTISTNDEVVEFKNHSIGNAGETELRQALDIMTGCKTFCLLDCGIDDELLARLREEYTNTKIVWQVHFGKYSVRSDTDTIRAVKNVFDSTCYNLRYCNEVKYMDLGHNDTLSDLSFVGFMPELEILIASGCSVSDLSGFENCKNLKFLELAYCGKLSDISPLAGCESLTDLNLFGTKVSSLVPLDGLPLEHFMCAHARVPASEQEQFKEIHPDCWTTFNASGPYGKGWRYEKNGKDYTPGYKKVREVFKLDNISQAAIDAENEALKKKK